MSATNPLHVDAANRDFQFLAGKHLKRICIVGVTLERFASRDLYVAVVENKALSVRAGVSEDQNWLH
jgi:hypothetical protein